MWVICSIMTVIKHALDLDFTSGVVGYHTSGKDLQGLKTAQD